MSNCIISTLNEIKWQNKWKNIITDIIFFISKVKSKQKQKQHINAKLLTKSGFEPVSFTTAV